MKKVEKRLRPIQKKIRLTNQENEFLNHRLKASPYDNFQNYARELLLTGEIKYYDYSTLRSLISQVKKIGVNINQIIHVANHRGKIMDSEIMEILSMQQELYDLVSKKIKTISACDYFNMTNDFIKSRYIIFRKSILFAF